MPAETHSQRTPWTAAELRELVIDRLAELVAAEPDEIQGHLRLADDLGLDDLTRIDLAEAIEEDLAERSVGFAFDDDDLVELVTVDDLVECVVVRATTASGE